MTRAGSDSATSGGAEPLVYGLGPRPSGCSPRRCSGSGLAQLDGTVVNVALPRIGEDLGGGLTSLQWTLNAYTLTLSGLLLLGGSLGDRMGRRRIFVIGVLWFTAASVGCALAPGTGVLIAMRALQGAGAALLTPGSLAILQASFRKEDRSTAVGAWSGPGRGGHRVRPDPRRPAGRRRAVGLAAGVPDQPADRRRGDRAEQPVHPRVQGRAGHRAARRVRRDPGVASGSARWSTG